MKIQYRTSVKGVSIGVSSGEMNHKMILESNWKVGKYSLDELYSKV